MGGEEKEGEGRGGTYCTLLDSTSQPKHIVFPIPLTLFTCISFKLNIKRKWGRPGTGGVKCGLNGGVGHWSILSVGERENVFPWRSLAKVILIK